MRISAILTCQVSMILARSTWGYSSRSIFASFEAFSVFIAIGSVANAIVIIVLKNGEMQHLYIFNLKK